MLPTRENQKSQLAEGRKIWKKAIVEMKIIGKAVHQVDRRLFARIFSDVNAVDLAARTVP